MMIDTTSRLNGYSVRVVVAVMVVALATSAARAQVVITEVMYDSLASGDVPWEWVEIKNTGASSVDLDGWVFGDRASRYNAANINGGTSNTEVSAGGVAVLYNAAALNFDPSRFTNAWGTGYQLIAVEPANNYPGMANGSGGDRIGLWASHSAYGTSSVTPMMEPDWTTAEFEMDYTSSGMAANPFPAASGGKSIAWTGSGDVHLGTDWVASALNDGYQTRLSVNTTIVGAPLNSITDLGTPGTPPSVGTGALGGLLITEVMYDPRSANPAESAWEWVEIYNNTGGLIDFGDITNPFYQAVFDDDDDAHKAAANLTSGSIPQGGTAVLFNAATNTLENMLAAWGMINFIPVSTWTDLGNGGDLVAIWPNLTAYQADALPGTTAPRRTANSASSSVLFDDDPLLGWVNNDGDASITLSGLDAAQATPESWLLSDSFNPEQVSATLDDHPGDDVGSPGKVGPLVGGLLGDFNGDDKVDAADYTTWRDNLGAADESSLNGNGSNSGGVDAADYALWKSQFGAPGSGSGSLSGAAVPEPTSLVLVLLGLASLLGMWCRRRK